MAQSGSRNPVGAGASGAGGTGGSLGGSSFDNGFGGVGSGTGASTPASARLHGVADAIRARGEARRSTSEAAINVQTARGKSIKNRVDKAQAVVSIREARFQADRLKRQYASEVRADRSARIAALRARPKRIPATLNGMEIDRYSGKLTWPASIRQKRFEKARKAVERELQTHFKQRGSNEARLLTSIETLRKAVGKQARNLGYREFASASKFVGRLRNHVRHSDQLMQQKTMVAKM